MGPSIAYTARAEKSNNGAKLLYILPKISVTSMSTAAKALIFNPIFGKRTGEIITIDTITIKGRIYINSIERKDDIRIKIVLAEAGRPTKKFSSFMM